LAVAQSQQALASRVYPLAKPIVCPEITLDASEAPDLAYWLVSAKALGTAWFPHICQLLSTQGFTPPKKIRFVMKAKQDAPAQAGSDEISFSAPYVRTHLTDLGMVVHEMTHVVQNYPENKVDAGWLVEGIADYVRWWRYEPEAPRRPIDFSKATYRDAYRTTAWWLGWVAQKYDLRLVPMLDLKLRRGQDPMPMFRLYTGKEAPALWDEFRAATERK
ncbi:MAG: basic secretory protein-like protein, partial [Armatimonadota bacterium]